MRAGTSAPAGHWARQAGWVGVGWGVRKQEGIVEVFPHPAPVE